MLTKKENVIDTDSSISIKRDALDTSVCPPPPQILVPGKRSPFPPGGVSFTSPGGLIA